MAANTKHKPARLGRGLSSLMGHPIMPVPVAIPEANPATALPTTTNSVAVSDPPTAETGTTTVTADLAIIATPLTPPTPPSSPIATSIIPPNTPTTPPTNLPHQSTAPASAVMAVGQDKAINDETHGQVRVIFVPIDAIRPNPHQPRQTFDAASLQGLADSIKADGVMQPVILRPIPSPPLKKAHPDTFSPVQSQPDARNDSIAGPITSSAFDGSGLEKRIGRGEGGGIVGIGGGGGYELIAGERRWRAAQLAGLTHIPAIVRELDDRQSAQWALVENLQRQDLNPMERAHAFSRLAEQFSLSHEQIAQQVGVDRSTITNSLRLLALSTDVQAWVAEGLLSNGHAKALASMNDVHQQSALATQAIRAQWSVRRLELAVKNAASTTAAAPSPAMKTRQSHFQDLEEQLGQQLQTKVHLRAGRRKGSGALVIEFYTLDQFDALLARLDVKTEI